MTFNPFDARMQCRHTHTHTNSFACSLTPKHFSTIFSSTLDEISAAIQHFGCSGVFVCKHRIAQMTETQLILMQDSRETFTCAFIGNGKTFIVKCKINSATAHTHTHQQIHLLCRSLFAIPLKRTTLRRLCCIEWSSAGTCTLYRRYTL